MSAMLKIVKHRQHLPKLSQK